MNTTVEIIIPEHVIGSVYGENGSNLSRMRQGCGDTITEGLFGRAGEGANRASKIRNRFRPKITLICLLNGHLREAIGGSFLLTGRMISGAKVVVHAPRPGTRDGMVIISGTPDQTQVAESLLQAFILG
ncbi:hypothetical protein ACLOJK_036204 [Asimina triloba]